MKVRALFEGTGIAILFMVSFLWPALSPYHLSLYHDPLRVSGIVTGLTVNLVLGSLLFWSVLALLDRFCPETTSPVWAVFLAVWLAGAIHVVDFLLHFYRMEFSFPLRVQIVLLGLILCGGLFLSRSFPNFLRKAVRMSRLSLALLGGCIFWMLPQLAYTAIRTRVPAENSFYRQVSEAHQPSERVVWILMDELSYDQVFDHRQPGLDLPHFDELSSESVGFSDVQPEGYYTERILPALFLGRKVNSVRSSLDRDLWVHYVKPEGWAPFPQEKSIFGEAKRLNWTTGVAGWYNPYCEILRDVLDSCYWTASDPFPGRRPGETPGIADSMLLPVRKLLEFFGQSSREPYSTASESHEYEYKNLTQAANSLIENGSIDFVFLHLPVPHPPGIYNRRTSQLSPGGSYIDNLALADKTLGDLLSLIQKTPAANRTTLILSSDHSWRVKMWKADPSWTKEDERVSQDKFDPRPVLMVHFPGQAQAELRTEPVPELMVHGILEGALRGKLRSQQDLDQWLAQRGE